MRISDWSSDVCSSNLAEQFSTIPESPLEIRTVEPFREKTAAGGSYQQGTPDGSRPGIFYYNAYDLPSRTTYGMETLYLHEGSPGHHFQISLAQENERSEEHTSELQSLMRISYAVFCLKKKKKHKDTCNST